MQRIITIYFHLLLIINTYISSHVTGAYDMISCGEDVLILDEVGSPRRCGGQGDVLAGSLGVAMYWAIKVH